MQHTGKISLSDYGGLVSIRGLCHSNADPVRRFSSGMKTFQKPEFYSVIKKSQSNMDILSQYFRRDQYCHSREEIALTLAPFSSEYFPMSIPDKFRHKIVEASQFKNMPIKICMKSVLTLMPSSFTPCIIIWVNFSHSIFNSPWFMVSGTFKNIS